MENRVAIESDLLEKISYLRSEAAIVVNEYGGNALTIITMQRRQKELEHKIDLLVAKEAEITSALIEKYGEGEVDLESGEYITNSK